jgi:outer membrane protein assembly factor BamB
MADFDKGTLTHLSLSSEGHLSVAPALKEVYDPSVAFLWAVARDSKGNLYAGGGSLGGSKAKLFAIDPQGRGKLLAELDGIAVQAIAIDRQDRVYAATSPDGKVYRVDASGNAQVFYDPKAKYIWALAFARSGDLYVATGDQGEIHRVTPAGSGSVFFRTQETHARSLAVDASDNLIVGTEPGGLILRVTPAAAGFVLYQTPKREITAVAVAQDGTIYAAGTGNRQVIAPLPAAAQPAPPATATASPGVQIITIQPGQPVVAATPTAPAPPPPDGSEIYRIQTDGYPRRIWNHAQDLVYTLAFDASGRLLAGTGNRGMIYRLDNDHSFTRLLSVEPTQITGLASAPDGRIYAVTGNIGKVVSIGPATEASGTIESDVLDAAAFSYWGRLTSAANSGVIFETRSGNLSRAQQNWSPWARLNADRVASPAARFLQYRATLSGPAMLADVRVAYEMKNVAPVVDALEITPPNYRFPPPVADAPVNTALTLPPLGRRATQSAAQSETTFFPGMTRAKGQIGARWLASDDNGDALEFKVEIRGVNETVWKLLRDNVRERYFSWDSTAFPDGKYVVRITASDNPSNPPDQALSSARESEPFLIDNTPPEISISGANLTFTCHAKDALSILGKAEYSIDGGDWIVVEPTTRITDSTEHDYVVTLVKPPGNISFRVEDAYGNQKVSGISTVR